MSKEKSKEMVEGFGVFYLPGLPGRMGMRIPLEVSFPEEPDVEDEGLSAETYEAIRNEIFDMMLDSEVDAYDMIDNFIIAPKAGLPDPELGENCDSLEARLEHAIWNNECFHQRLIHSLAALESSIAYYATLKLNHAREDAQDDILDDIQREISYICLLAKELELLTKILIADYETDIYETKLEDAQERSDILTEQLMELYEAEYDSIDGYINGHDDDLDMFEDEDDESEADGAFKCNVEPKVDIESDVESDDASESEPEAEPSSEPDVESDPEAESRVEPQIEPSSEDELEPEDEKEPEVSDDGRITEIIYDNCDDDEDDGDDGLT